MTRTIKTVWELRTYDVWGNLQDGFEVNDVYLAGQITLDIPVTLHNPNTMREFESAMPTHGQIRKAFGLGKTWIVIEGDDVHLMIDRRKDAKPLGEMICISHESLSPVRKIENVA